MSRTTEFDLLAGRFVAWCVHPRAAWHRGSRSRRTVLVAGYLAAGYVATLASLTVF